MSVAGIDVGNASSCIALARKGGVDVLLNKESNRETPAVCTYSEKQRMIGTAAAGGLATNPKNTVSEVKRLLGKQFDDPIVQADISDYPFSVVKGPNGEAMVEVNYLGQLTKMTPEQVMAALLVDLRDIAEKEDGAEVKEVVLSVPVYYTEKERYSMLAAARIAGLQCLRLLDETTATALAYGIYKTDLPETDPVHVAFVDVGHSSTQVCVVALKKGELSVLSNAWDRNLGGRDFDKILFNHFADEFDAKHKIDVRSNLRSAYRLTRACEKTKKIMTTNPIATINVESLTPDVDANSKIDREVFEEKCKPILDRLLTPVRSAVEGAGLTPEQIHSVEIVGGASRMPCVQRLIQQYFGKEPSRTLNSKETVSRGCALQCAMLSPAFRVREFQVQDSFPYTVEFSWDKDGEKVSNVVFNKGSHVPCAKMLTFYRSEQFEIQGKYSDDSDIPSTAERIIGKWSIGPIPKPSSEEEKAKLKVKVVLTKNGVVSVESVSMIEETEVPVAAPTSEETSEDKEKAGDEQMPDAPIGEESAAPAPPKPKIKTKKTPVNVLASNTGELTEEYIQKLFELESEMALQARIQEDTADAKNAVESYVYDLRNQMYDSLANFVHPDKKQDISSALEAAEEWLYDEGEDEKKSVYVAKLKEIEKLGEPIKARAREAQARPAASESLRKLCNDYISRASSSEVAHIAEEDLQKVVGECQNALNWLEEKEQLQSAVPQYDDPVIVSSDITKRGETVSVFCLPILNKPPPPPPKKEEEKKDAEAAGEEAMDTEDGDEKQSGEDGVSPMEGLNTSPDRE
jgi:heat shock protein 4